MRAFVVVSVVSAWLGAALLLAASVAPAAFGALPSRDLAGAVIGRVLPVVFISGALAGLFAFLLTRSWPGLAMAVACAIAQFGVDARIARLRAAIGGPVDALAADDPRRVAFGRLHGVSVTLLGLAMIGAAAVVVGAALAARPRPT